MALPLKCRPRVALATCRQLPDLDDDGRLLIAALADSGIEAEAAIWDRAGRDWSQFDLVIVRTCWDYVSRYSEFLAWARQVRRLCNPGSLISWNSNKSYLADLAHWGLPVIPTSWLDAGDEWRIPASGEWVVKPSVSIASMDTGRYDLSRRAQRTLLQRHIERIHASKRTAMIQPYMSEIDTRGETSLVFFNGAFSHAVRKEGMLRGPDEGIDRRFLPAGGQSRWLAVPTAGELSLGRRLMSAIARRSSRPLYARVDLVASCSGPVVMELELIEPQLYLREADVAGRFAKSIAERLGQDRLVGRAAQALNVSRDELDSQLYFLGA